MTVGGSRPRNPEGDAKLDVELERRRSEALGLGGPERVRREHAGGRLTVRERIDLLLDPGSFHEIGSFAVTPMPGPDGEIVSKLPAAFVCGFGTISGRRVVVGGEDYTVQGGAVTVHLEKFKGSWTGYVEDLAYENRVPLILLMHGGGGSVSAQSAKGYAYIVSAMLTYPILELLDRVPVVTAVMGPVAGSGAARVVCSHFSVMSRPSGCMFAGGPPLVQRSLSTKIDKFDLGGVDVQVRAAGNVDNSADTEPGLLDQIRGFLSYLPASTDSLPPVSEPRPPATSAAELAELAAAVPAGAYDVREVISGFLDASSFFEIGAEFGGSLITGLGRVEGHSVGVLANNAAVAGGMLDGLAADKQVRFTQLCDTFHVPIVYVADSCGLASSAEAEASGVLRRAVRAMEAIHRATVPVLTLQVGRSGGIAGMAASSPNRLVMRFAWPTATIVDEGGTSGSGDDASVWPTVESFGLEEVIAPEQTRDTIAAWLGLRREGIRPGPKSGPQFRP
jgi:methylmalonyl-CoA decarboxylase subunit alpha